MKNYKTCTEKLMLICTLLYDFNFTVNILMDNNEFNGFSVFSCSKSHYKNKLMSYFKKHYTVDFFLFPLFD